MARTQEQRKAVTRARLVEAAADQFARRGFHAVSTEAVADAADRTTGALYAHFGSKEGLLFALVDDYRHATADAVLTTVPDPGDLDGIIAAAWDHIVASDGWLLLEMELWLHGARDDNIGSQLGDRYARIRADLADGLAAWAAAHEVDPVAPASDLAARALSFLLGAALQHRLDPASITAADVIDAVHLLVTDPRRHP